MLYQSDPKGHILAHEAVDHPSYIEFHVRRLSHRASGLRPPTSEPAEARSGGRGEAAGPELRPSNRMQIGRFGVVELFFMDFVLLFF